MLSAIGLVSLSSCGKQTEYYQLVGGDPKIDYLEFVNDSVARFVSPSLIEVYCPYTETDGHYTIAVMGLSRGRLHRIDANTLQGEPPFFDGTWKRCSK